LPCTGHRPEGRSRELRGVGNEARAWGHHDDWNRAACTAHRSAAQQPAPVGQPATGQQATAPAADRQQPAATDRRADNLRIYINATRELLEATPEYKLLSSQEGGFFGGGSAR
jgi:hypothetical protein